MKIVHYSENGELESSMLDLRVMNRNDLNVVNLLLHKAFKQARIDDGYKNTHVPMCRFDFLDMYLSECPEGCFVIQNGEDLAGAVFCHVWGKTGWIGPLAVSPDVFHLGIGKKLVHHSVLFLKRKGCTSIGLETNPRSSRNLGFYVKLDFIPAIITLDVIRSVKRNSGGIESAPQNTRFYSQCHTPAEHDEFCTTARNLTHSVNPDVDYTPLIQSTLRSRFGDSVIFYRHAVPIAYCTFIDRAFSSEEKQTIMRVISFVAHPDASDSYFRIFLRDIDQLARYRLCEQLLLRLPAYCSKIFPLIFDKGFRIIHSDLRMTLNSYTEKVNNRAIHLNRWV
jgi:ribosomal protein S18 acetylase RimI-like enzyme